MKTKQETGVGFQYKEYKEIAENIEKELKIEKYVRVTIERRPDNAPAETLHTYDLPRDMMWEKMWILEWRKARYICQYPRDNVNMTFFFYDKTSGLDLGFNSTLSQYVAAKGLKTKYTNALQRHLDSHKGELFYNPDDDALVQKAKKKIARAQQRISDLEAQLENLKQQVQCS